jgi:DNA-binding beta-propeller fold protein YncE
MRNQRALMIGLIALSGGLGLTTKPSTPTLKNVTEFDLPGPPGKRFHYLTIDPDDHYLLSAHLAAGQMYVIDLRTNKSWLR